MKIKVEKKRVTMTYERLILDDGFIFSDVGELVELLEQLNSCDGYIERVVIYNNEWEKKLEEMGVISTNSRGSAASGKKFKAFYDKVYKLVNERR